MITKLYYINEKAVCLLPLQHLFELVGGPIPPKFCCHSGLSTFLLLSIQ